MSLVYHDNGWKSFDTGRIWRCKAPDFLLEVEWENNIPSFSRMADALARVRRVRSFYAGKMNYGLLDQNGTALDIITANAWNLKQYGENIDRWVSYYNTSRKLAGVLSK